MKLTRKQLRKLINEAMIKPGIPNVPSAEAQGKIDDLARQEEFQASADSMAHTFGYPEDRSFSKDLKTYDEFGRLGPAIGQMTKLGTKYADAETHGEPEEYYIRRDALKKAAEICDSFDMSMVRPLIDAFTDAANDYERAYMKRLIGASPRFEYEAYDIAGRIALKSHKLDFSKGENYSNLYDGTYINETRRKLRRLVNETIYVNPQGDAFDNRQNDPTGPFVRAELEKVERQRKIDFLRSQGDERLHKFAPADLDIDDASHDPFLNQGIEMANLVGDQGEFQAKPIIFTDDELALRDFADQEFKAMMASPEGFNYDATVMQGRIQGETDYSEQIDRLRHLMTLRAKKVLNKNPRAKYFDVVGAMEQVPSYKRLMQIVAQKEGDFSQNMQKLNKLPEKLASELGVRF